MLVGLGGLFAWWWLYQSKKPYFHRGVTTDKFEWLLEGLAKTTQDGTVLIIEHEGSTRFLQFVTHNTPSGACLGFSFPDAPWSREYFDMLRMELSNEGFEVGIGRTGDEPVRRFLEVELQGSVGEQIKSALRVAAAACRVMNLNNDQKFTAHFRGLLDSRMVIERSLRRFRQAMHRRKQRSSRSEPQGRP